MKVPNQCGEHGLFEGNECPGCMTTNPSQAKLDPEIKEVNQRVAIELWLEESLGISEGLSELISKKWVEDLAQEIQNERTRIIRIAHQIAWNHADEGMTKIIVENAEKYPIYIFFNCCNDFQKWLSQKKD